MGGVGESGGGGRGGGRGEGRREGGRQEREGGGGGGRGARVAHPMKRHLLTEQKPPRSHDKPRHIRNGCYYSSIQGQSGGKAHTHTHDPLHCLLWDTAHTHTPTHTHTHTHTQTFSLTHHSYVLWLLDRLLLDRSPQNPGLILGPTHRPEPCKDLGQRVGCAHGGVCIAVCMAVLLPVCALLSSHHLGVSISL